MKYFLSLFSVFFITFNMHAIQIVGSDKLCQDLIILMGGKDNDLEVLYNELISGQLVEEDKYLQMKELEDYVLRISTLYHNLCTPH